MKIFKRVLLGLLGVFLIIQIPIFNPDKNYSELDPKDDIATKYKVPMGVLMDVYAACYDCHSNYTEEYPWYYNIQPISWWMDGHIDDAKSGLNFSEFATYSPEVAAEKFHHIHLAMKYRAMPLKYYTKMHEKAQLSDEQYDGIAKWAKKMHTELVDKYDIKVD